MKPCVYKVENKINGKVYIGVTNNFKRRMREHKNESENPKQNDRAIYRAIRKYGWNNFDKIILEENNTIEECFKREQYYIDKYNSLNSKYGYNMTIGGIGGKTHDVSGEKNPMYGRKLTDEHKAKMSKSLKGKKKPEGHGRRVSEALKGKPKSEKHKENLKKANKGKLPSNCKAYTVINIHTGEILNFISGAEMERVLKASRNTIDNGKVTKNGYKLYVADKGEETIESIA